MPRMPAMPIMQRMPACYPDPQSRPARWQPLPLIVSQLTVCGQFATSTELQNCGERPLCAKERGAICTGLSSFAQWLGPEEGHKGGLQLPERSKRDPSEEGLWKQSDTEPAAGWPPRRSGGTWGNKEEFWKKSCPLALLQTTQMGFLSHGNCPFIQTDAGPLCEGGGRWLALLSRQRLGVQCSSPQKPAANCSGLREPARIHMKA
jgi:hypothetical protein